MVELDDPTDGILAEIIKVPGELGCPCSNPCDRKQGSRREEEQGDREIDLP